MCEEVGDAIEIYARPNCKGPATQITETGSYALTQPIGSFVIPPNFQVLLHSQYGKLLYDAKVWGHSVEDAALTLDKWNNKEHFALSEAQWVSVVKHSPEALAHSCVGWSEPLVGYEPSTQRCQEFLDAWCAQADTYGSEVCLQRPWVVSMDPSCTETPQVWLSILLVTMGLIACGILVWRYYSRLKTHNPRDQYTA